MFYDLLWTFSSTDASVQVCTLPCSSHGSRVVDMPLGRHAQSTRLHEPVPCVPLTHLPRLQRRRCRRPAGCAAAAASPAAQGGVSRRQHLRRLRQSMRHSRCQCPTRVSVVRKQQQVVDGWHLQQAWCRVPLHRVVGLRHGCELLRRRHARVGVGCVDQDAGDRGLRQRLGPPQHHRRETQNTWDFSKWTSDAVQ